MKHNFKTKLIGLTLLSAGLAIPGLSVAAADVDTSGGINIGNAKKDDHWFSLGGGMKLDQTFFMGSANAKQTNFRSGANLRDVWLDLNGGFQKDFTYTLGLKMDGTDSKIKLEDVYVTYKGLGENLDLSVGQVNPGFCLENTSSSKWSPFLERSMPSTALAPCPGLGVSMNKWGPQYAFIAAVTAPKQGTLPKNASGGTIAKSDRWLGSARFIYAPIQDIAEHKILQIGVSGHYQDDGNKAVEFKSVPEAKARNTTAVLNTTIGGTRILAKHHTTFDVELSGQNGPFYAEAEYQQANVKRSSTSGTGQNLRFRGWHVQGAYVLTGESRAYKMSNGTFGKVSPKSSDKGAWEVAARYSYLSLNSKDIKGGKANNTAIGLNYYATENLKVSTNYIHSKQKFTNLNRKLNILGLRLQMVF